MTRIVFDDWTLLPATGELARGAARVRLQEQPLQVLLVLLGRPGELVTREELIAKLWPKGVVDFDTGLNSAVRKLRSALGDEADSPRYIERIPRRGYRFIGRIASPRTEAAPEPTAVRAVAPVVPAPSVLVSREQPPSHSRRDRPAQVALVGVVVVVLGAAAAFFGRDPVPRPVDTPAAVAPQPLIAILPFVNLSPDPADAFFADGMHEEIIGTLTTRAAALDVVPRTTMMTYRAAPESIERVVSDLGASHVLEGSVRRDGAFVRLTVQLVDGRSQRYLWSRSYDRELGNALSLQSEVAGDVASELQITLIRLNREPAAPTGDSEAYDAYLKARLSFRDGDWVAAADLAAEAIRRDASFGAAYVTRSAASNMQIVFNLDTTEARLEKLHQDLQEAARLLGEDDPVVLAARAMHVAIADRDYDRSFALFATAEAAGLKDTAPLRTRAMQLVITDRLDDAIAAHRSLAVLDPGNFVLVNSMAVLLSLAHRPADALRVSDLVVERFPDNNLGHLTRGRLEFAYTGRTASWRAAYEAARPTMTVDQRVMEDFDLLRYENRFVELRRLLDADATTVSAGIFNSLTLCCVGTRPLAEYRGWAALLANDADAALRDGREVLDFAAREPPTRWNEWYLQLLRAEGLLMTGADAQAADAARVSLALVPRSENAINWRYAAAVAARVFAWGGAPEDAITLLEELDVARPGLRPAEITHDPLYQLPLEGQPRYEALQAKLSREIIEVGW